MNWAGLTVSGVLALLMLPSVPFAQTQPPPSEDTISYSVLRGDTLIDLARAYLNRASDYRLVQLGNRVTNERRLRIGQTLKLPVSLLRATPDTALVTGFRGNVSLTSGGTTAPAIRDQIVREGALVSTGANSFARLRLSDGSFVVVPSNSRVRLSRLRRFAINGAVDHALTIEAGRAESQVTPRQQPGGFVVRTPVSVSAVRGTYFRVSYPPLSEVAATEVLEGIVDVESGDGLATSQAHAAQSVSVTATSVQLVELLPPPALQRPSAVLSGSVPTFDLAPTGKANLYRGRLATDAGMIDAFAEAESLPGELQLRFNDIPDGPYFLRVSAVSAAGVEGRTTTYSFVRARNGVGGLSAVGTKVQGVMAYRFRWEAKGEGVPTFRFQLLKEGEDGKTVGPALVDHSDLSDPSFAVTDLPPGVYSWRVQVSRHRFGKLLQQWSEPQQLRIGR